MATKKPAASSKGGAAAKSTIPKGSINIPVKKGATVGTTTKKSTTTTTKKTTVSAAQKYKDEFDKSVAALLEQAGGADFSFTPAQMMSANSPVLKSAQELAQLYGLDYNYDNIYNTLMKSVNEGAKAQYAAQDITDGKYYDQTAAAQSTLLGALDQQRSQAVLAGTNKGMQAAQALSSMLGVSQQFAGNATALSDQRGLIGKEYNASLAKAGESALNAYNTMGQQLGDLSKTIYSADTSSYVGELDYNASAMTANASAEAAANQSRANLESALVTSLANIQNTFQSGLISEKTAKIQADASIKQAQIAANATAQYTKGYTSGGGGGTTPAGKTKAADKSVLDSLKDLAADKNNPTKYVGAQKTASQMNAAGQLSNSAYDKYMANLLLLPSPLPSTYVDKYGKLPGSYPAKTTTTKPAISVPAVKKPASKISAGYDAYGTVKKKK